MLKRRLDGVCTTVGAATWIGRVRTSGRGVRLYCATVQPTKPAENAVTMKSAVSKWRPAAREINPSEDAVKSEKSTAFMVVSWLMNQELTDPGKVAGNRMAQANTACNGCPRRVRWIEFDCETRMLAAENRAAAARSYLSVRRATQPAPPAAAIDVARNFVRKRARA